MKKEPLLHPALLKLRDNDMSSYIKVAGFMLPKMMDDSLKNMDEKQRGIIDKVLPVDGKKKIYVQLAATPTPPIVIEMAQPVKVSTMSEQEVKEQRIKGIRLTVYDIQLLANGINMGTMLKLTWRLKWQMFTIMRIVWMVRPLMRLRGAGSKDKDSDMMAKYKPLIDIFARQE